MRRIRILAVLGIALLLGSASAFTDLSGSRYAQAITYLSGRGVLSGYPDGSFRPAEHVTRAELTTAVMRAVGLNIGAKSTSERCFEDVLTNSWAAPYLCAAKAAGIVVGEDGRFYPERPISYAEAAKIALLGLVPNFTPFKLGPWYLPYLDYAAAKGLYGDEVYKPDTLLRRGVMAKLLYEALALGSGKAPPLTFPSGHHSAGCGSPPPGAAPSSLMVQGRRRKIITALPEGYRSDRTYALVVAFHGRTNPASEVRRYYDLEQGVTNTIFVYPSGLPAGGGFSWWDPGDPPDALRDYALFDTLLATFRKLYCLDTRRVFLVGHSLGASFVNSLACARGNEVRAIGTLAGGIMPSACKGRVAAMLLHNPEDRLAPISLGEKARDAFLQADGLTGASSHPATAAPPDLGCVRYGPAAMAQPVVWCEYHQDYGYQGRYYPHNWPRDTGRALMNFFASLP